PFFEIMRNGLALINEALGSQGVQRTLDGFKAKVQGTFGGDTQATVNALATGVINFGQSSLTTIDMTYRGWQFFRDGVTGVVAAILEGFARVYEVGTAMTTFVHGLPGGGHIISEGEVERVQANAAMMRSLTNEFWSAGEAAKNAWQGNDAFVGSLRAA